MRQSFSGSDDFLHLVIIPYDEDFGPEGYWCTVPRVVQGWALDRESVPLEKASYDSLVGLYRESKY